MSILLANLVYIFHLIIILFVLLAPFSNIPYLWILHVAFCVSLIVHWLGNSNVCSLSMIESQLRGLDYTESFTHQFISPVYDISKSTWSRICYMLTIGLTSISLYKLYNSIKLQESISCFRKSDQTFLQKYSSCLSILMESDVVTLG